MNNRTQTHEEKQRLHQTATVTAGIGASIGTGLGVGASMLLGMLNLVTRSSATGNWGVLRTALTMGLLGGSLGYSAGYTGARTVGFFAARRASAEVIDTHQEILKGPANKQ
tara:strand:- start:191 stop:523 length:333 start_codon:yes stop_codon:yes gene_type:complete